MLVHGDTLLSSSSGGNGDRNTKDGVRAKLALVGGTVKLDEEVIDLLLLGDLEASLEKFRSNDVVDVGDSLADTCSDDHTSIKYCLRRRTCRLRTLANVGVLVAIAELNGFVNTGGCTRGNGCPEAT